MGVVFLVVHCVHMWSLEPNGLGLDPVPASVDPWLCDREQITLPLCVPVLLRGNSETSIP